MAAFTSALCILSYSAASFSACADYQGGYKMKRRVGDVEEFSFESLNLVGSHLQPTDNVKQLHITIAVTGWLNEDMQDYMSTDLCIPWRCLAESREQYSLCWESKYLYQLGQAFDYIVQTGITMATTEALKYTVLSGLITAIAWPAGLIAAAGAIDNPWHVCNRRATEAGKALAEVLLSRQQFLFRTVSVTPRVAGLGPVKWNNRRMHNIDLSDVMDRRRDIYMVNAWSVVETVMYSCIATVLLKRN